MKQIKTVWKRQICILSSVGPRLNRHIKSCLYRWYESEMSGNKGGRLETKLRRWKTVIYWHRVSLMALVVNSHAWEEGLSLEKLPSSGWFLNMYDEGGPSPLCVSSLGRWPWALEESKLSTPEGTSQREPDSEFCFSSVPRPGSCLEFLPWFLSTMDYELQAK